MDKRKEMKKPLNADFFAWGKFVKFARKEGIGEHPDDYEPWWKCWKAGYTAAVNE